MEALIESLTWRVAAIGLAFFAGYALRSGWLSPRLVLQALGLKLSAPTSSAPGREKSSGSSALFHHLRRGGGSLGGLASERASGRDRRALWFDEFEVDLEARQLSRNGVRIHLQPQPLALIEALLESPGEIVSREKLRARLWPSDENVEFDLSINAAMRKVRIALSDSATRPKYIETHPQLGYRFIAAVRDSAAPSACRSRPGPGSKSLDPSF